MGNGPKRKPGIGPALSEYFYLPYFNALGPHKGLGFLNGVLPEVENGGSQYSVGSTDGHPIRQMLELTHTTGSNDRHRDSVTDGPGQPQVKAGFGTVPVHAGEQQFTCPHLDHFTRPLHGIQSGGLAATVG